MEAHALAAGHVDAVGHQHVQVHVEVGGTVVTLDEGDDARACIARSAHDLNNLAKKVEGSLALEFDNANPVNRFVKLELIEAGIVRVVEKHVVNWLEDTGALGAEGPGCRERPPAAEQEQHLRGRAFEDRPRSGRREAILGSGHGHPTRDRRRQSNASVTAPREAELTRRAYLASNPRVA